MSADNFIFVDQRGEQFVVLCNLSASMDYTDRQLDRLVPVSEHATVSEALIAAHLHEERHYHEYGVVLSSRAREALAA